MGNNAVMARSITEEEKTSAQALLERARTAMTAIEPYDQATVDRLCRAIAWATAKEQTFGRLTALSVEESGRSSASCGTRSARTASASSRRSRTRGSSSTGSRPASSRACCR
jgi:hypothetical protein